MMIRSNLLITLLIILAIKNRGGNCQDGVKWTECSKQTKGVFCLGGLKGQSSFPGGTGCFKTRTCDTFVFADARPVDYANINNNKITWEFYQATPRDTSSQRSAFTTSFFVTDKNIDIGNKDFPDDTMFAFMFNRRVTNHPLYANYAGKLHPSRLGAIALKKQPNVVTDLFNEKDDILRYLQPEDGQAHFSPDGQSVRYIFQSKTSLFYPQSTATKAYQVNVLDQKLYATMVYRKLILTDQDEYLSEVRLPNANTGLKTPVFLFDVDITGEVANITTTTTTTTTTTSTVRPTTAVETLPETTKRPQTSSKKPIIIVLGLIFLVIAAALVLICVRKKQQPKKVTFAELGNQIVESEVAERSALGSMSAIASSSGYDARSSMQSSVASAVGGSTLGSSGLRSALSNRASVLSRSSNI